jgi:hypothetical protein
MLKKYEEATREFEKNWLDGTECKFNGNPGIKWQSEDGRFILMWHRSHPTYLNRIDGSSTCKSHFDLYDLDFDFRQRSHYNHHCYLVKWYGRWNKQKQKELEEYIEKILQFEEGGESLEDVALRLCEEDGVDVERFNVISSYVKWHRYIEKALGVKSEAE